MVSVKTSVVVIINGPQLILQRVGATAMQSVNKVSACAGFEASIQCYVDGELTGEECVDVLSHVENCSGCSRALHDTEALSLLVRNGRPSVRVRNALREAVIQAVQRAEPTLSEWRFAANRTSPFKSKPTTGSLSALKNGSFRVRSLFSIVP
ncbi:anti-sigma factor family protein [Acidisarcina polymorpha]|uniref:anti-sigma factor family protein n=1 Tax=Acidisarcina polymorpha TaxID=2211140 RepID=UPI000DEFFD6F